MRTYDLSGLDDAVLTRDLDTLIAQERSDLAAVLAHIAEVDARRLYLHAGFPSMYAYCLGRLRLSEQSAMKRIRAGRAARRIPGVFEAVAEGRVHLSAIVLLAPHLHAGNVGELLRECEGRSKFDIEHMLARRFPRPDVPTDIQAIEPLLTAAAIQDDAPGRGGVKSTSDSALLNTEMLQGASTEVEPDETKPSPGTVASGAAPTRVQSESRVHSPPPPSPRPARFMPLAPERFAIQFTIGKETLDDLRVVQALLSHSVARGDVAQVFALSLKTLKRRLEQRKFAAAERPRSRAPQPGIDRRTIPAHVKRAVWERDQGQCTFVSESGQRCASREFLEFDHVVPVARGGVATVEGIRLRCRGHNQLEAERAFGSAFMESKRERRRRARTADASGASTGASMTGRSTRARVPRSDADTLQVVGRDQERSAAVVAAAAVAPRDAPKPTVPGDSFVSPD